MIKKKVIKIAICVVAVIVICVVTILIIQSKKNYKKIFGMSEEEIISILDKNKYEYKRRAYESIIDINDEMSINGVKGKYTIELYEGKVFFVKFLIDIHEDSVYDKSSYLEFKKDSSFINSDWKVTSAGEEKVNDCFKYKIDENRIITAVDTTEYEGHDSFDEYEIGIMYKNYICVIWEGKLPQNYTYATISNELGEDLTLTYNFYDDKTYELMASGRGEISYIENGTYSINGNEVVCISDEIVATFININDRTCCIEYIKE